MKQGIAELTNNDNADAATAISPLVDIVQNALVEANGELDMPLPKNTQEFSQWYLAAMQVLSTNVAARDRHRPTSKSEFQMMCRCALTATDLREAIALIMEFSDLLTPRNGRQWLVEEGDAAVFYLDSMHKSHTIVSDIIDITGLYSFYRLFQWLTGVEFELARVGLGPAAREDIQPFLHLFNASVLASGDYYSLEFAARELNQPVVRSGQELVQFLDTFPGHVFGSTGNELARQVRAMLMAAIQRSQPIPTLKQLSAMLAIPESTFRRRLAETGLSYRGLREDCLQERAKYYLLRGDIAIEDLSRQLGFSDDTSFRRAFRSWVGMSPTAWRDSVNRGEEPSP